MMYEYDFEDIGLTEDQRKLVELGMAKVEDINSIIKEVLNRRSKDGWEAEYPFSVPMLWFKRPVIKKIRRKS